MKNTTEKPKDSYCPQCGKQNIRYNEIFYFYKCFNCEHVWSYNHGDPDYDESED